MNEERRKAMKTLHTELTVELPSLELAHREASAAVEAYNKQLDEWATKANEGLVNVRNDEELAYDNMPEGLQNSDKGQAMQDFISTADTTIEIVGESFSIEFPTDIPEEFAEFLDGLSELAEG